MAPSRGLVVKPLRERLTAHFPARPELVELILDADPRPGFALIGGTLTTRHPVVGSVVAQSACSNLDPVHPVHADQPVECPAQPGDRVFVGEVDQGAVAVPPLTDDGIAVRPAN